MDIRKLQRAIVDGLEDVMAQNVVVFNTYALSPLFERVIIASGSSNRQTKALASSVRETVKSRGMEVLRMEGEQNGEWIIVDCGAAVAHIMQPSIRDYYHLEEIWGAKPVAMKRAAKSTGLVKASEPAPAPAPARKAPAKAPVRKAVAKAPARKAPSKAPAKAAGSTAAKTAAKTSARAGANTASKSVAKAPSRATASRAPSSTVVVARKTPARKAAKPAAKAPARKAVAPARKAPARKTGSTKG
jgi:ribosome-associated protein